jgi:hypothetical protein
MTAFPVDRKRRWDTAPGRWQCLFLSLTSPDFQIADFIEFDRLEPRINHWQRITGYGVSGAELVSGVRALPDADEKFPNLSSDVAAYRQRVAQILYGCADRRSGSSGSAAVPQSTHRATGSSPSLFLSESHRIVVRQSSLRQSRSARQEAVLVMKSVQDGLRNNSARSMPMVLPTHAGI